MERPVHKGKSKLTWILPLLFAAGVALLYALSEPFRRIVSDGYEVVASGDQQRVQAWVKSFGPWGIVVLLGLMLMQSIVAVLPSIVTIVASVIAYGPVWGALLAAAGMLMTATFMYTVGRCLGPVTMERFVGAKTQRRVAAAEERYGSWAVVAARLTPILSTDAVSFVAGAIGMKYRKFIAATALGTGPLIGLIGWLGRDMGRLKTGLIIVSVASAAFFLGAFIYERVRKSRGNATPSYGERAR